MRRLLISLAFLLLAACGNHVPTCCQGPAAALNPDYWQPTQADLVAQP